MFVSIHYYSFFFKEKGRHHNWHAYDKARLVMCSTYTIHFVVVVDFFLYLHNLFDRICVWMCAIFHVIYGHIRYRQLTINACFLFCLMFIAIQKVYREKKKVNHYYFPIPICLYFILNLYINYSLCMKNFSNKIC